MTLRIVKIIFGIFLSSCGVEELTTPATVMSEDLKSPQKSDNYQFTDIPNCATAEESTSEECVAYMTQMTCTENQVFNPSSVTCDCIEGYSDQGDGICEPPLATTCGLPSEAECMQIPIPVIIGPGAFAGATILTPLEGGAVTLGTHRAIATLVQFNNGTLAGNTIIGQMDVTPLTASQLDEMYKNGRLRTQNTNYRGDPWFDASKADNINDNFDVDRFFDPSRDRGVGVEIRSSGDGRPFRDLGDYDYEKRTALPDYLDSRMDSPRRGKSRLRLPTGAAAAAGAVVTFGATMIFEDHLMAHPDSPANRILEHIGESAVIGDGLRITADAENEFNTYWHEKTGYDPPEPEDYPQMYASPSFWQENPLRWPGMVWDDFTDWRHSL